MAEVDTEHEVPLSPDSPQERPFFGVSVQVTERKKQDTQVTCLHAQDFLHCQDSSPSKSGDARPTLTPRQSIVDFHNFPSGRSAGVSYGVEAGRTHSSAISSLVSGDAPALADGSLCLVPVDPRPNTVQASFRYSCLTHR